MKQMILVLLSLTAFTAAALPKSEFTCHFDRRTGYGEVIFADDKLTIAESFLSDDGTDKETARVLAERVGITGDFDVHTMQLAIDRAELQCTSSGDFTVKCQAKSAGKWTNLEVWGSLRPLSGYALSVNYTVPLQVESFEFESRVHTGHAGIKLLDIDGNAELNYGGVKWKVGIDPNFSLKECKKL